MEKIVDIFAKNVVEEVRVQLQTYKGYQLIDIRVWRKVEDSKEPIPTRKGITIKADLLPLLKEAVLKAEKELESSKTE